MVYLSLAELAVPARQAAKQASANISKQLGDSDSDHTPANKVINKYGKKAKAARQRKVLKSSGESEDSSLGGVGSLPRPDGASRSRLGKRIGQPLLSIDIAEDSDSELTPLTPSDLSRPSHTPTPASPSHHSPQAPRPFPLLTDGSANTRNKRKHPEPRSRPKLWKKKQLGDYVWVLIDNRSRVYDREDKASLNREYIWWPAKISRSRSGQGLHISVVLCGRTSFEGEDIRVNYPAEDNILPFENSAGVTQFQSPTYVTPSHHEISDVLASPRKKAKRDHDELEQKWRAAVVELNAEREGSQPGPSSIQRAKTRDNPPRSSTRTSDEESLPEIGQDNWKASLSSIPAEAPKNGPSARTKREKPLPTHTKGRRKGKRKSTTWEGDYGIEQLERLEENTWNKADESSWLIPLTDESLQIPGELIFAIGNGADRSYWPARVLEYIPPKNSKEKEGRYQIEYLDRTTTILKRSSFFTSEEDGFATCKLGQFESSYDEIADDSETEETSEHPLQCRAASPVPSYPLPSKEDFCELDLRSQFVYTKPILAAVLNEKYPPARERHDKFLKGGAARKSAVDSAAFRGELDPRSVVELQKWLCQWCLRDEMSAKDVNTTDNIQKSQSGSVVDGIAADGASPANQDDVKEEQQLPKEEVENQQQTSQDDSTAASGGAPDMQDGQMDGAGTPIVIPAMNQCQNTVDVVEGISQPPSSIDTTRQPPNPDVPMADIESIDHDSPLSSLSESMQEVTPTRDEGPEEMPDSIKDDTNNPLPGLTEVGYPTQLTSPISNMDGRTETALPRSRQYGCPAFEALRILEKLDYCLNVLLPEAIIQVLLWRKGLRNAMELLPLEEEQRLHDEGIKLLQVTDWVFDVMRLRKARERYIDKVNGTLASSQASERGGGRLRNVGRVNYIE